jgi:DNA (cytosine-5)-methyltransferase 1
MTSHTTLRLAAPSVDAPPVDERPWKSIAWTGERSQDGWAWDQELIVDLFAGGGGASQALEEAYGQPVTLAVNHDPHAIAMHRLNHPNTWHFLSDVWEVTPTEACGGIRPYVLWGSPDCAHFSRAKGCATRQDKIRGLAWVIVRWAKEVRPRQIFVENVPEFLTWGPLDDEGKPIKARAGETFEMWVRALQALGYQVEWCVLSAAGYGTITTRTRLYLIARSDGLPIVWPEATHWPQPPKRTRRRDHRPVGHRGSASHRLARQRKRHARKMDAWRAGRRGRPLHRIAAECIDWSLLGCSIFASRDDAKAWAEATGAPGVPNRPLAPNTLARVAEGLRRFVLEDPNPYVLARTDEGLVPLDLVADAELLAVPTLVNTRNGERPGQRPRVRSMREPLPTITAQGSQGALAIAWLAKHYKGVIGHSMRQPIGTVTAKDHHSVCFAFLSKYNRTGSGQSLREPLGTVTSRDRFGLVTVEVNGETYAVVDITLRMLTPRELATAQGFSPDYALIGTRTQQIARIGNSVCPPVAASLLRANAPGPERVEVAA